MSEVIGRRLKPRYPATISHVIIALTKRHHVSGSLVNISRTGALLGTEEKPALHSTVRVRLNYPIASPWMEAKVVRIPAQGQVGIAFTNACDPTLFYGSLEDDDLRMATYHEFHETAVDPSREDSTVPGLAG